MSLVVFPFRDEKPGVVLNNVGIAAHHPRVEQVLCVGYEEDETYGAIEEASPQITAESGTRIDLAIQQRIGSKRPGKGDGMNTALRYFLDQTDFERIHFYDADITTFGPLWITQAENAADLDYDVVRHYFPRASTDAMITWFVTRSGFAILFPRSELPWIEQPLGGELLFTRSVVEKLLADSRVTEQSDWGIDTMYTFCAAQNRQSLFESYVQVGKAHSLYGRLTDLRTMLVEVFAALQSIREEKIDGSGVHRVEYPDVVPHHIAERVGFEFEASLALLPEDWTDRMVDLLELLPTPVAEGLGANRLAHPVFGFMDDDAWHETLLVFLDHFELGDSDWEELLFKAWLARVLNYTITVAVRGYSYAGRHLRHMVTDYIRKTVFS